MFTRLEDRLRAEQLGIKIRWTLIGAAILLLLDVLGSTVVLTSLVAIIASNLIAKRFCVLLETYSEKGATLLGWIRFADLLLIGAASFSPIAHNSNLWLLAIPVIVTEALVSRSRRRVTGAATLIIGLQVAASLYWNANLLQIITPACVLVCAAIVSLVLSSYKSRDEVLTSHDIRLQTILECGSAIAASDNLYQTLLHTLKAAVTETGATCGYILLANEDEPDILKTEIAFSEAGEFNFPKEIEVGTGMSGIVAKLGQPFVISDTGGEEHEYDGVTDGVHAAACVPLVARSFQIAGQPSEDQVLGVMSLLSLTPGYVFQQDDIDLLRTMASLLAVAVANARMEQRRRTTFLRTLESLAKSLEARDEYTRGHSQRVCDLSLLIAERMGLGSEALEEMRVGTLLHDIGKIGVPDAILNKPDRLSNEEFEIMKTHPVIGYEICKPLQLSDGVLLLIRNHHEKLDGSGYPDGLKGGELPLSLRIVCVADAFDAMSSRRPYRSVMAREKILSEMSRCAGSQFDPVVVETLKHLYVTGALQEIYAGFWSQKQTEAA